MQADVYKICAACHFKNKNVLYMYMEHFTNIANITSSIPFLPEFCHVRSKKARHICVKCPQRLLVTINFTAC